jgi:FtsH-binding integral membrane protein
MMFGHPVLLLLGYVLSFGGCVSAIGAATAHEKTTAGGLLIFGIILLVGALALWIFGIVNAYRAAEQANSYERI